MKLNSVSLYIVIFFAGITTGFYILLFLLGVGFFFSKEIGVQLDPINLATLLVTILLAIYVTRELNKRNEQERVEKNLIIEDIRSFKSYLLSDIKKILETEKINYLQVVSKLKTLRMNLNSIIKLIEKYHFLNNKEMTVKLDNKIRDIKDLLTETPAVSGSVNPEITINNGEISLGSSQRDRIDTALNEMASLIFELVFEINRC